MQVSFLQSLQIHNLTPDATKRRRTTSRHVNTRYLWAAGVLAMFCMLANFFLRGFFQSVLPEYFLAEDLGAAVVLLMLGLWSILRQKGHETARNRPKALVTDCQSVRISGGKSRRNSRKKLRLSAYEHLQDVLDSLGDSSTVDEDLEAADSPRSRVPSRSLYHFHASSGVDILLPVEVAACQYAPDVSEHLQRLLADRWAALESGHANSMLTSIAE